MIQQTRRRTIGALLVGATILGAGGAFLDGHATVLARAGQPAAAAAKHPVAQQLRKLAKLRRQILTVDSVTGTTIAATTRGGAAITVATSGSTTFTEAGATVTIAAVQPREHLLVRGAVDRATHTIQATKVLIVVPAIGGVVTNVTGSTVTLTGRNAVQRTITIPNSARIEQAGQSATVRAITVGSVLTVQGTTGAGGSFTVLRVVIRLPRLAGRITAVNGASFTLQTRQGTAYTVTVSASTTYTVRMHGAAPKTSTTAPAIAVGERAFVAGTLSQGGTTIAARHIVLAPASAQKQPASSTPSTTGA